MWSERIRSRFTGQPPNRLISERRRARRARSDRRHQPATAHRQNEVGNPAVPNLSSPAALRTSPGRCGAGSTSLFRTPSGPSEQRTAGRATDGTDERLQQNPKVGWGGVQFAPPARCPRALSCVRHHEPLNQRSSRNREFRSSSGSPRRALDDNPRWRSPERCHGFYAVSRMGPPPRSFAADAHGCIMVATRMDPPNTRLWRE